MLITLAPLLDASTLRLLQGAVHGLADADWCDGGLSAGAQARHMKNNDQLPKAHPVAQHVAQAIVQAIGQSSLALSAALPKRIVTPQVNRYSGGKNHYGPHVDGAIRYQLNEHGQREAIRTDVSCTVFLNDPDDYEGGELLVHDTYGEQRVKLPAGHAVLYPATSVHQVTPVTQGQRLAAFFWIESLVRDDSQRRLLFDLDQHVMHVRTELGEQHNASIGLSGTYHNLLRLWSTP